MRHAVTFGILLLGLAAPGRAWAESADALFTEGLKLFDAGRVHEACERFEASLRLDPALGTLQNLATCHEADGRTARAHAEFIELADRAQKAGAGQKARELLGRQRAAALAKKLSRFELRLAAGANVEEILVDDAPLDRKEWQTPLALDPGPHTITFRAAGKKPVAQPLSVSVTPGTVPLDVPRLEDVPRAGPPPRPAFPLRNVAIGVGAAGVVGIALGSAFGGLTFARKSAAAAHCTGMYCDPDGLSLQDSAHRFAAASTGSFVVGLAAAGTGAFLFVWSRREPRSAVGGVSGRPAPTIAVGPSIGASAGGVQASGAW